MQQITECSFSDHPAVSQELMKFLSMNTSMEAVDVLTNKMKNLEDKLTKGDADMKGVTKSSSILGNILDELNKQMKDMLKWVQKLEK